MKEVVKELDLTDETRYNYIFVPADNKVDAIKLISKSKALESLIDMHNEILGSLFSTEENSSKENKADDIDVIDKNDNIETYNDSIILCNFSDTKEQVELNGSIACNTIKMLKDAYIIRDLGKLPDTPRFLMLDKCILIEDRTDDIAWQVFLIDEDGKHSSKNVHTYEEMLEDVPEQCRVITNGYVLWSPCVFK